MDTSPKVQALLQVFSLYPLQLHKLLMGLIYFFFRGASHLCSEYFRRSNVEVCVTPLSQNWIFHVKNFHCEISTTNHQKYTMLVYLKLSESRRSSAQQLFWEKMIFEGYKCQAFCSAQFCISLHVMAPINIKNTH